MFLNGIDFPNQVIDAIKNDKLVVFAGAGASVDKPTALPNFENLAREIADGTGYELKKKESCEVFLGFLKSQGVDVNEHAAQILSGSCKEPNALHKAIVDLFVSPNRVKIVTTNYDQMFEATAKQYSSDIPIFSSPALPLGNDINGIIHIHGNVSDSKYMVVTDEDFGNAYLTEGYASRFLVKLFETYTVLFIGYSYNDTILRYLTRAMSREHSQKRYILTDDSKSNWDMLGITVISFPKKSFKVMREGLIKLGKKTKKGLIEWKSQFSEIADCPPKDLTIETEIEYCLADTERAQILASCVKGRAWLEVLDSKGIFAECFSRERNTFYKGNIWGKWLCENFIGIDDDSLKMLIEKHGNIISKAYADEMIRYIAYGKPYLDNNVISEYIILLIDYIQDPWIILQLIENVHKRKLFYLCFELFKKLFSFNIKLQKRLWIGESLEYKHSFLADYHHVNRAWVTIGNEMVFNYAYEIVYFVKSTIEKIHFSYENVGQASDTSEPWNMAMLIIEDRENDSRNDPLHVLIKMFLDACAWLQDNRADTIKSIVMQCITSRSILLKKIALRELRECSVYENAEKIDLLLKESSLSFIVGKEQVFLLVAAVFEHLTDDYQNHIIDEILLIDDDKNEMNRVYEVYNWCVWLQRLVPNNNRINSIIAEILKDNEFAPRKHPELDIELSSAVWLDEKSPIPETEMRQMGIPMLVDQLINYNGDNFDGPSRRGLLNEFSNVVKNDYKWSQTVALYLIGQGVWNEDIWNRLLRGVGEADASIEDLMEIIYLLSEHIPDIPDVQGMATLMMSILRKDEIKTRFSEYEANLFEFSLKLWDVRSNSKMDFKRVIDSTLNTAQGLILLCWIYMISYSGTVEIDNKFKALFSEVLSLRTWEKDVAVCILAGHFNFFCYRDKEWAMTTFSPFLTGNNKRIFRAAWEGIAYYSGRINRDTADIIAPIYLKAVKHVNWLNDEAERLFIELYLTLLIHIIEKPTLKYIPEFYKAARKEQIRLLLEIIGHRLRGMDAQDKIDLWISWLAKYLENRKSNKPIELSAEENGAIFELLPELDEVFDEAVNALCRGKLPSKLDGMFWYQIDENNMGQKHPHSIASLMTKLLSGNFQIEYNREYILKQVKACLVALDPSEKKDLQEALLKHNINMVYR